MYDFLYISFEWFTTFRTFIMWIYLFSSGKIWLGMMYVIRTRGSFSLGQKCFYAEMNTLFSLRRILHITLMITMLLFPTKNVAEIVLGCPVQCSAHIPWWRHQMETFSALLAICAGNSPVPGEFPAQRLVARSFDVFFDLRLNKNDWVNNREAAGDLRRHRGHYDVIVMLV